MRKSKAVGLGAVGALAAAFVTGCEDDQETAYCVDEGDRIVQNRYCERADDGFGQVLAYYWFFGGHPVSGSDYRAGVKLTGGKRVHAADKAGLAKRGGFGQSARPGGVGRATAGGGG